MCKCDLQVCDGQCSGQVSGTSDQCTNVSINQETDANKKYVRNRSSSQGYSEGHSVLGSPHHLIMGHNRSSRDALKYLPEAPPVPPVLDRSPHYIRAHGLEKSRSLNDKRSPKTLRSTKSLSPRPPIKHQHSIFVSDESNEFVAVRLGDLSPHTELSALSSILASCESQIMRTVHIENVSPNKHCNHNTNVASPKPKRRDPMNPWTKIDKHLFKTTHKSLEETSTDPWVINSSARSQRLFRQTRSLSRHDEQDLCYPHALSVTALCSGGGVGVGVGNTLTVPGTGSGRRPKLVRCKTPVLDIPHDPSPAVSPEPVVSPRRRSECRSPKAKVYKTPKALKSPESDYVCLLPDQLNCTCDLRISPRQSPRRLSPSLGYKSLCNDHDMSAAYQQELEAAVIDKYAIAITSTETRLYEALNPPVTVQSRIDPEPLLETTC